MSLSINLTGFVNCSNSSWTHIEIFTPIPSYGTSIFGVFFLPIIVILGCVGNLLSIIILNKSAKTISSHYYLWWLAVFDIISLLSYIPSFWAVILLRPFYYYARGPKYPATWIEYGLLGKYICEFRLFITFTSRACSVYTIILVTMERFIMIVFPLKKAYICKLSSAKISVTIMAITSVLVNFPWIFTFDTIEKPCFPLGICVGNTILLINRMIEFTILCLIPCIIIVVCNGCIIYILHKRVRLKILVNSKDCRKKERDITIRLLAVSFAFFLLTIPSLVVISIHTIKQANDDYSYLYGPEADAFALSIILFAVNLAINFIIYCLTGENFRRATLALLKCNLNEMRKYQAFLATEIIVAAENNRFDFRLTSAKRSYSSDFHNNHLFVNNFQSKRSLISV